jgi:DNA-binding NtrC family response regulator
VKILIVDDEADIGFILGLELQIDGHEVISLTTVSEAISYLKDHMTDAIVCDFQMPLQNGLDLFNWLEDHDLKIPFYILTGEPLMDSEQLKEKGVKDILFKPQDLVRLSAIFR